MFELRILSGLHRGAVLPLHDADYLIGASDDADVVLTDDGIAERHAVLAASGRAWVLTVEKGPVFSAESNKEQTVLDLNPGSFARIGDIWIVIAEQGAPWDKPPPLPEDTDFDLQEEAAPVVEEATAATGTPAPEVRVSQSERSLGRRILLGGVALVTIFCAAAAYAINAKLETASHTREAALEGLAQPQLGRLDDPNNPATALAPAPAKTLSPKELQTAFRRRLAEADLLNNTDLDLQDASWTMQANLNADDAARFNRILTSFVQEHAVKFPVHANLVGAEAMLPFEIRQVVSGANPNIVTKDGQRLFVGEEFRGVRVVAIDDNHLVFAGKRKIEMNW